MEKNIKKQGEASFVPLSNQREKKARLDRLFVRASGKEDVSRREEFVKHFDLGANRHQAVIYPTAVHYRESDEDDWKEIDNTLEEAVTAHGRRILRNHAGRVKMEFPQKMDNGDMASITCNGRTFAWRFEKEMQPVHARARTGVQMKQERLVKMARQMSKFAGRTIESLQNADLAAELETEQERRADIAALKAETAYENVLPGVSVRYELNGSALKEDIILANKDALAQAAIRLPATYDYTVTEKNALIVMDKRTGEQLFSMNTPLVYDAEDKQVIANVVLTACNGYTRMEYHIDEDYLNNAVYPVTIDPVVNSSNAINNIQDTTIGQGRDYGYPNEEYMMVGKYNSSVNTVAMLKFVQLAKLTASDTVISAVLNIAPKSSSSSKYIGAYEILKPWNVNSVGWENFDPTSTSNISADAVDCIAGSSSNWLSFDLTKLYRKWCTKKSSGTSNNNGVAFHTPANISGDNYSELYSANASNSNYRPIMYVSYVSHPNGQTVNYTYDASQRVTGVQTTADGKTYRNGYTYENDRIKTVSHNTTSDTANDVTYTFEYDSLGRKTNVKVGTQILSTNVYETDRSGLLSEVQYGNDGKVHYEYDEFDRLKGIEYDDEGFNRYTYQYAANGQAAEVQDEIMGVTYRTEYDLSDRPCRTEKIDSGDCFVQRTDLKYDKLGNLAHFTEELRNGEIHRSSYSYDRDNRITEIAYDNASDQKVAYTYDALGRIIARTVTSGSNVYTTTYEYVEGGYDDKSTTSLVKTITQPGICFDYAYDNRGNIISEKRYAPNAAEADKKETTYEYDALGQLIRVNDPHEVATWVYSYDRGGNILSKSRYRFTTTLTENLGAADEVIPYSYGDSNWKDKLTAYNGQAITYDAIGNPLFDGVRTYTWGAGRQLKHISMPASNTSGNLTISNGSDADSQTELRIVRVNDTTLEARVMRGGREITAERPASAFNWTRASGNTAADTAWNNAHAGMKQITLTVDETIDGMQFACTYSETAGAYGTVQVNDSLVASHTPATADANDVFTIENGALKVTTSTTNGTDYALVNGVLSVNNGFSGTITSTATFNNEVQTKEIDFIYDHNGLRTGKIVTENGKVETTEYTLHGKLITHMTKRTVDENGDETIQELHFFYDTQSKPAFVEFESVKYRYVYNLQGDVVGIVDTNGNPVVEYKYDAWGSVLSITGTIADTLGKRCPFRYRNYIYDDEIDLYYLRRRYYSPDISRFVNEDSNVGQRGYFLCIICSAIVQIYRLLGPTIVVARPFGWQSSGWNLN